MKYVLKVIESGYSRNTYEKPLIKSFNVYTKAKFVKLISYMGYSVLIIFLLATLAASILGQELPLKDVEILITLPDTLNETEIYDKPLYIKNNDDTPGVDDALQLIVELLVNSTLVSTTTKNLNSYSASGMGELSLNNGTYNICGKIIPLNFNDTNISNNEACKKIFVGNLTEINLPAENQTSENSTNQSDENESDIPDDEHGQKNESRNETENEFRIACDCVKDILTNRQIYRQGETIKFSIDVCEELQNGSKYSEQISYWVEDSKNTAVKSIIQTTSKAEKSFTPNLDREEYGLIIKASTQNCTPQQKLVLFVNEAPEPEEQFIKLEVPETVEPGKITTIKIDGYKADTTKTLLSVWLELNGNKISETTKIYIEKKQTEFSMRLPVYVKETAKGGYAEFVAEGLGEKTSAETKINAKELQEEPETEKKNPEIKQISTRKLIMDEIPELVEFTITTQNNEISILSIQTENENIETIISENKATYSLNITKPTENIKFRLLSPNRTVLDTKEFELSLEDRTEKDTPNPTSPVETQKIVPLEENTITGYAAKTPEKTSSSIIPYILAAIIGTVAIFRKNVVHIIRKTKLFK